MFGYWSALVLSALLSTAVFGPVLWQSMRNTPLFLPGLFQDMGLATVIIAGLLFHRRVRLLRPSARPWAGVLLGALSLACGYALYAAVPIVVRLAGGR